MYVSIDQDVRIWVDQDGNPEGIPVLVPSGMGSEIYRKTLSWTFRQRARVLYVDVRGTGGSPGEFPADFTYADLADDLEKVRVELDVGPVVLFGQSNHGAITLEHALRYPAGNAGTIQVGTVLHGIGALETGMTNFQEFGDAAKHERLARDSAEYSKNVENAGLGADESFIRRIHSFAVFQYHEPDLALPTWSSYSRNVGAYGAWVNEHLWGWSLADWLGDIEPPLLVINGKHDFRAPYQSWTEHLQAAPETVVHLFEHSAHWPHHEESERFDELALNFLTMAAKRAATLPS